MPYFKAFLFGITIATAVGPIALWIVNQGVSHGWRAGAASALGAALADLLYALVAFLAGSRLAPLLARHEGPLQVTASLVLLGMGGWIIRGALRDPGTAATGAAPATQSSRGPLLATWLLTLANPLTVIAFIGLSAQLPLGHSVTNSLLLAASLFLGSLAIQLVFGLGGAGLGRLLADRKWIRGLNLLSGAGIALFGLVGLVAG